MVKFSEEEFEEVKEVSDIDELNSFLEQGWSLMEARYDGREKRFLIGKTKKKKPKELLEELEKHIGEEKENKEKDEKKRLGKEAEKGIIALVIGFVLAFIVRQSHDLFSETKYTSIETIILGIGILLIVYGLSKLFTVKKNK